MSDMVITFTVLGVAVVLFVWNKLPVEVVALLVALSLYFTQVLTLPQALAGFSDPTVVLIAGLFVVSMGLEASGITTWMGQQLVSRAGTSRIRLIVLMFAIVAVLTALISVNGAVAALIPMVVIVAVRLGHKPSQLLMPLAFAAHAGSQLTLTGSPVNVLISEALGEAPGGREIGFFEFALAGIPLLVGTVVIVILFGDKLLPHIEPKHLPQDLGRAPVAFRERYFGDATLWNARVPKDSPLIGLNVAEATERALALGVRILVVEDPDQPREPLKVIEPGVNIVLRGDDAGVDQFVSSSLLAASERSPGTVTAHTGIAEFVVAPGSELIGAKAFPGMITDSGQLVIMAIQRGGTDLCEGEDPTPYVELLEGDMVLLQGTWNALEEQTAGAGVLHVHDPEAIRQQAAPLGPKAWRALIITAAMIVTMTLAIMPAVIVTSISAIAMVVFGVVKVEQAHRSMSWTTLILVAAMIPLSTAISVSGAAELIATSISGMVADQAPQMVLLGLFLVTVVLGQLISNMATALVLIPVALALAADLNLSPITLLMSICVAAAASFLTPVATPANTMIMAPAGYRFGDYWKLGLPLIGWYGIVSVLLVPLIWPF